MKTRLITTSDIETILLRHGIDQYLDDLIDCLRKGFLELDPSKVNIPVRAGLHYHNPDLGLLEWMPAMAGNGKASLKIVGYHPTNPQRFQLPTILSTICIFDTNTGHLNGILDGTFATATRTGAMSALATSLLSASDNDAVLGVVGCGAQAVTQIHALSRTNEWREIIAFDTDPTTLETLPHRLPFLSDRARLTLIQPDALEELLERSDVICTCTSEAPGKGPVLRDGPHKPHLHINAVGSDFPGKTELPLSLLRRSIVVPDFTKQALAEGECQQLDPDAIACDLSQLLKSEAIQTEAKRKPSVFDSTGHAYADYLAGSLILSLAERYEAGSLIEIECAPPDPKDPYSFLQARPQWRASSLASPAP